MRRRSFITNSIIGGLAGSSVLSEGLAQAATDKPEAITNKRTKSQLKPFYVAPDNNADFTNMPRFKINFLQSDKQFSAVEFNLPPKTMGPAPHVHKDLDEFTRVLKGTVTVMVGGELFEVKEGGWHLRPHGIVHTFWNAGDEPAMFIDIYPNQNFEVWLDEALKLFSQFRKEGLGAPADSKEARRRMDELNKEWGMVMYYNQRKPLMDKYGLK